MYFVFRSEIVVWRNQTLQAELRDFDVEVGKGKSRIYVPIPEPEPAWWDAQPLIKPLPQFVYKVNKKAPLLDNYFTGNEFDLYSNKLVQILRSAKVDFESFPVTLVDRNSNKEIEANYMLFHLLVMKHALDMQRSEFQGHDIKKLQLTEECLASGSLMFRVSESPDIVLIHSRLRELLDSSHITGCSYIPVEKYQTGGLFGIE